MNFLGVYKKKSRNIHRRCFFLLCLPLTTEYNTRSNGIHCSKGLYHLLRTILRFDLFIHFRKYLKITLCKDLLNRIPL